MAAPVLGIIMLLLPVVLLLIAGVFAAAYIKWIVVIIVAIGLIKAMSRK